MTNGDYLAIGILTIFGLLGVFRCFSWVLRLGVGVSIGCAVLVAATCLRTVPMVSSITQALETGVIVPALAERVDSVLGAFDLQLIQPAPADASAPSDLPEMIAQGPDETVGVQPQVDGGAAGE